MDEDASPVEQVNNVTVKRLALDQFTVEGYSRAAVQTFWRIKELGIGFDLGAHPWEFMGTAKWMISHTHLDHIAALPVYVARRRLMKMAPPKIYVPAHAIEGLEGVLRAFGKLDRGRLPCELIGVEPGDEFSLSRDLVVSVHKTYHSVPSVGYIVWERRRKLKPEFSELKGEQIRDLRESGTEITNEIRIPKLGFVGDSTPKGLDENPDMYRAQVLITEMTFVAKEHRREKIHKNGHMHLDDYIDRKDRFENEVVIAAHLSTRYNSSRAAKIVARRLPCMLGGRLHLWG